MESSPVTEIDPKAIAADIAREYREDGRRWTQKTWARDAQGHGMTNYSSPDAVCWCLRGAIDKRVPLGGGEKVYQAFNAAVGHPDADELDHLHFVDWNDAPNRTVGEVIDLCEKVAQS